MTALLTIAGVFLAGFWLGGTFLSMAIVRNAPDEGTGTTGKLVFSALWPITMLMSDEL